MKTVIEMAREAGLKYDKPPFETMFIGTPEQVERFAALVRADEQMKALEVARTIGGYCAVEFEQEYLK